MVILQEKLLKRMGSLWNMTQEMQNELNQETSKLQSFEDYAALRKVMIKVQHQQMHLFLHEREHLCLETLEKEAKETVQQLKESEVRMTHQKESLTEMYRELTEMCHKPDVGVTPGLGKCIAKTNHDSLPQLQIGSHS
ncbi:tripartite motif-containing protein 64C-like [Ursus americanus]|uniref:tripartite motif-containing protein 64C-like n=1 Tax=Ursus americanus TaxID=9643 RepID=UPI001E67D860|nr:tripartite motif-containing protein 64C-like [Ursus americanus]